VPAVAAVPRLVVAVAAGASGPAEGAGRMRPAEIARPAAAPGPDSADRQACDRRSMPM